MRYAPLLFILGLLGFTLLLTIWGPVQYGDFDPVGVSTYLGFISIAMSFGYFVGVRKPVARPVSPLAIAPKLYDRRLFNFMLLVASIGFIFTVGYDVASHHTNLDPTALGATYSGTYTHYEMNSGHYTLNFIIYSLCAAPTFFVTIWGIYFFKTFRIWTQALIVLVAIGTPIILTLTNGTQQSFGYFVIYMMVLYLIKSTARGKTISPRTLVIASGTAIAGISILVAILSQRYAAEGINALNANRDELASVHFDVNSPIYTIFGSDIGFILSILCEYLTNGLAGLSYCLHAPFTWSYMLGTSYSVSVIGERLFNIPLAYHHTYPYLVGELWGWNEHRWHTVFSWFASDFTFYGTVPLFGYFAFVYARCWIEALRFQNPYSILLFSMMSLGVLMMTCNNQLMQSPAGLSTLLVVAFLYLRFRRRYNRRLVLA